MSVDRNFGARIERDAMPVLGARFWRGDDGVLMFSFVIDPGNVIGPRLATKTDSEKHPAAWTEFVSGEAAQADAIEVVPDARDEQPPAPPETVVPEKDMEAFAALLEPAPEAPSKRKYTRRQVA